jgi:hypothetical protein
VAGLTPPAVPARAQWGLLLRLHFLILRRQATATPGRRLVTTLLVVLGSTASLLLGFTAFFGMVVGRHRSNLPPPSLDEAVHLSFALVYGVLVLSPALGFRGNEFLDVTRLFHLPVSHRTVLTAATTGIGLSGAVLFWLPPLAGVVLGYMAPLNAWNRVRWSEMDWGLLAVRLGLLLAFLFHAVAVGQLVILVLLNFLRSRRWQDLGMVIAPLVAGVAYLATFWALSGGGRALRGRRGMLPDLLSRGLSDWIPFLPSRWLTETLTGAASGPGPWLPFLLGFLPLTLLVLAGAAALQERAFLGEVPPSDAGRGGSGRRIPGGRLLARLLPDPVLAVASKEVRLLRREPVVKTVLIGQAFFLTIPVVALALRAGDGSDAVGAVARVWWLLPYLLVFVENTLTLNLLGLEGPGISHLRTTPAGWRRILLGKDLCYLLGFGTLNALFCAAVLALVRAVRPEQVPEPAEAILLSAVGGASALAVVLAVGNVLSVALPTSLAARGRMALRQQTAFSEGCFEKLARLAVFAGTLVLVAPIPLALHVLRHNAKGFFQEEWWPPVAVAFSLLYAGALLRASLPVAERTAAREEDAILRRLTRPAE